MKVNDVNSPSVSSGGARSAISRVYTTGFRNNPWTYTVVALWISVVMLVVHNSCILVDRTDIPLQEFESAAVKFCGPSSASVPAHNDGETGGKVPITAPPSIFSVAVWVNHPALVSSVHDAIDSVRAAMSSKGATVQRVVQLDESIFPPTSKNTVDGFDMSGAQLEELQQSVVHQQLGIDMLNHVSKKNSDEASKPYGISFVVVQRNGNTFTGDAKTHCTEFAANQALCLLYVTALSASDAGTGAELGEGSEDASLDVEKRMMMISDDVVNAMHSRSVRNAIGTFLAKWWGLKSFKSQAELTKWQEAREVAGCIYTLQAVRSLQSLLLAHPSMPIPEGVRPVVTDLQRAINSHAFVGAARASERLQFHPLLIPQVFLPLDHVIVTHAMVMIPVVLSIVLSLKIWSLLRRHNIRVKKEEQERKKEKENKKEKQNVDHAVATETEAN